MFAVQYTDMCGFCKTWPNQVWKITSGEPDRFIAGASFEVFGKLSLLVSNGINECSEMSLDVDSPMFS